MCLPFLAHGRISVCRFGLCRQRQHCAALRPRKYADSYFHRHTVGLDTIGDNAGNIPSPEEVLLYNTEREEQVQEAMELVQLIAKSLTKVQFRRLWLHHVQLENVRTIAKVEGVAHPSIVASITSAQRKILKIVQKHATKAE